MTTREPGWVLGVDSGGSGLRLALVHLSDDTADRKIVTTVIDEPVRTDGNGIDTDHLLTLLRPAVKDAMAGAGTGHLASAAFGAAGMASLGTALRERLYFARYGVRDEHALVDVTRTARTGSVRSSA